MATDAPLPALFARFVADAAASLADRPGRTLLTMTGIVLGLASIITTSGLALSAQANVSRTFDAFAATSVTLRAADARANVTAASLAQLARLPGATDAGALCVVKDPGATRLPGRTGQPTSIAVVGVSPGALSVLAPTYVGGGDVTSASALGRFPVAVVGVGAWRALGGGPERLAGVLEIKGRHLSVGGVLADVRRHPSALGEIYVPQAFADATWGRGCTTREVIVTTRPGAAQNVGAVAAATLTPAFPGAWTVTVPPSPDALAATVRADLTGLYVALAAMSVVIGTLSIGNTMSMSVLERTAEIGARRAIGFTRGAILWLFGLEAVMLGLMGGLLGASAGVAVLAGVTWWRDWPFLVEPGLLLIAAPAGGAIGFLGGIGPALRAGWLSPAAAVRA